MERKSDTGKILLAVLGVAILIVSVVGVSFAVFSITRESDENTIKTGTITVSYVETSHIISTENALPVTDETLAKASEDYFEFTVSTTANGVDVPYEINLQPSNDGVENALTDSQIKVYLTTYTSGEESSETMAKDAVVLDTLTKSQVQDRTDCYVIYSKTDNHTSTALGEATTTTYRLRMWIDKDVKFTLPDSEGVAVPEGQVDASKKYTYKLKVNVDSTVKPIGTVE